MRANRPKTLSFSLPVAFQPIIMTTMAAMLAACAGLGGGVGAELRMPLGITIVGG